MKNPPELVLELIEIYEIKLQDLERNLIPRIKENFLLFQALYKSVYELFIQKGILRSDPYKNERHLSDIYALEEQPMTENELDEQLPIKLSEFDNLLDFLNNYTQFKASVLSLKKLKILTSIVKYIDWSKLTPTNNMPITHGVAALAEKIKLGSDNLASGFLQSTHNKLDQLTKVLLKDIKTLAEFKREEYKLFLRQRVIQQNPAFQSDIGKEDFARLIKAVFARAMEGEAYFPELIQELFVEVYERDIDGVRKSILERFHVEENKKKSEQQKQINLRDILFDGLRSLGTSSRYLDECVVKLKESADILKSRPKTFWEKFREWIIRMSQGKEQEEFFEVELIDINTSVKRSEKVAFNAFTAAVAKKSRYLTSLLVKNSASSLRLEASTDDQVYDVLEKNLVEIKNIHDRLDALDTYFKSEAPTVERGKMRGIKVELGNLKNSIALVNQRLHEFVAKKDELEQLRKLGINAGTESNS